MSRDPEVPILRRVPADSADGHRRPVQLPRRATSRARGKAAPRRLVAKAGVVTTQTTPRPIWLYVTASTVLACGHCARQVSIAPLEMWADPEAMRAGKLEYTCDCGEPFDLEDFIVAGARLVAGLEGL